MPCFLVSVWLKFVPRLPEKSPVGKLSPAGLVGINQCSIYSSFAIISLPLSVCKFNASNMITESSIAIPSKPTKKNTKADEAGYKTGLRVWGSGFSISI